MDGVLGARNEIEFLIVSFDDTIRHVSKSLHVGMENGTKCGKAKMCKMDIGEEITEDEGHIIHGRPPYSHPDIS